MVGLTLLLLFFLWWWIPVRVRERRGKIAENRNDNIKSQFCGPSSDAFANGDKFLFIGLKWWKHLHKADGFVIGDERRGDDAKGRQPSLHGNSISLTLDLHNFPISLEISSSVLILQLAAVPSFAILSFSLLRGIVSRFASWKLMMDLQTHNSAIYHRHFLYSASSFFPFHFWVSTAKRSTKETEICRELITLGGRRRVKNWFGRDSTSLTDTKVIV